MKKSVIVTIERKENKVEVSNNLGKKWEIPFEMPCKNDSSVNGVVAHIASAMLTGTIASQLKEINSPTITYTLTIETK